MTRSSGIRSALLGAYVHQIPDFRGKWRLLSPFAPMLEGIPVRSGYGDVRLGLDIGDRTHRLGLSGGYGTVVSSEVEKLDAGDCFIDVGANCGVFSLLAADRVGPDGLVVAFEPCFTTFAKLVSNIGLNDFKNVLPFNMALSDITRPDVLDSGTAGHSGRYAIAREPVETGERILSLALRDFPGLMKLIGDRPIIMKIDVEGFEHEALQGLEPILGLAQTRSVVVEIDPRNLSRYGADPPAIYALLERQGFCCSDAPDAGAHFDAVFHRKGPAPARPAMRARPAPRRAAERGRRLLTKVAAAAAMLLIGGWMAAKTQLLSGSGQAEEYFVTEALQSHNVDQVRKQLRRSAPAKFNLHDVESAARIDLPILPPGWRLTDVQLFPADSGFSLQMTISNGKTDPISLFAVRDDKVAPSEPDVTMREGKTIAYWQEGDLAYALIGRETPAAMDRLAEDIADNVGL